MRTLTFLLFSFALLAGGYRFLASLIVKDGAEVILENIGCPERREPGDRCSLKGSISTDFVSGDMVIVTADQTTWMIPQSQVRGVIYPAGTVRYEIQPAAMFPLALLALGGFAAFLTWRLGRRHQP